MIVTCVTVYVKKDHIDEFIAATLENHDNSIKEPGNVRFDVLQREDDPGQFFLYEVYETEESVQAHKQTPHYLKWRQTVEPWMEKSRVGTKHRVIAPSQRDMW